MDTSDRKKRNKRALTWILISAAVLLNGMLFYFYYINLQETQQQYEAKRTELQETYNKLESVNNELDLKIEEIKKLGGDVEELQQAKKELENEKKQLIEDFSATREQFEERNNQLQQKVQGYEALLKRKDKEIERLKDMNEELLTENTELKEDRNQLTDSLSEVQQQKSQLGEKVEKASQLKAEDLQVVGFNWLNNEKVKDEYRNGQIETLKVEFTIAENQVAPIGGRKIRVRILEPNGDPIFDVAKGSGTFMLDDEETFYTSEKEILYDRKAKPMEFSYEKGSDYVEGKHTVEVYANKNLIGKTNFIVK